jgi:hypothetical protein
MGATGALIASASLFCACAWAASPGAHRAYELVSPPEKNGANIAGDPSNTRVATDGDAVSYASLGAFADAVGTGVVVNYVSVRKGTPGTSGWVTHSITPPQEPSSLSNAFFTTPPFYLGDFSADLSRGIFRSMSPSLTAAPNVEGSRNLYLRTDLLKPGPGSYQLATDSSTLVEPAPPGSPSAPTYRPFLAGTSSDLSHVVFESVLRLTADAPPCPNGPYECDPLLYEWAGGAPRLVGILPQGQIATTAVAGRGATLRNYLPHVVSSDGSRIFFTVNPTASGTVPESADLSRGNVYARIDGTTTVQLDASERSPANPDPNPPASPDAHFWDATPDGAIAFFTSSAALTDSADSGGLYSYDFNAPLGHRLTLLAPEAVGIIGTSIDGQYVYFITGEGKVDLWHSGTLRLVTTISDNPDTNLSLAGYLSHGKPARVSPDGRYLLFASSDSPGPTAYVSDCGNGVSCQELYEYDAAADGGQGRLTCASCNPSGNPGRSPASAADRLHVGAMGAGLHLSQMLANNGLVFFATGDRLVPDDMNGTVRDVYEYNPADNSVHLISSGRDTSDSLFVEASPDGRDVFFLTRQRLVGWDVDDAYDLYDARIGGGFPEPPKIPVPCSADACHGKPSTPPDDGVSGSAQRFGGRSDASRIAVFSLGRITRASLRRLAGGGTLVVKVRVSEAGRVKVRAHARIAGREQVVSTAAHAARTAGVAQLRLRLSPLARRSLARRGSLWIHVAVTYSEAVGITERFVLVLKETHA